MREIRHLGACMHENELQAAGEWRCSAVEQFSDLCGWYMGVDRMNNAPNVPGACPRERFEFNVGICATARPHSPHIHSPMNRLPNLVPNLNGMASAVLAATARPLDLLWVNSR